MKSYTDLEQSKKLAEILPLESADMAWYPSYAKDGYSIRMLTDTYPLDIIGDVGDEIPAWSLAALLEEIPDTVINTVGEDLKLHIDKDNLQYSLFYENEYTGDMFEIETELYDDMIDACCEMILKLNKQDIL